jgi:predicted hydrocarbon binding protein
MNNEARQKSLSLFDRTEYYDDKGEWQIAGSDWVLMSGAAFRNWCKLTEQILGPDAKTIMYEVGKRDGEQFSKALMEKGFKDKELKYALEVFFTNGGWGRAWVKVDFLKQRAEVRIRNSVSSRQTKTEGSVCHVIRGYIAGVLGVMFNKKIECVEMQCRAKGDAFCEFRIDESTQNEVAYREKGGGQIASNKSLQLTIATKELKQVD